MSTWRLLGVLPSALNREEIRAQSLEGWNPWQTRWIPSQQPPIVLPDPENPGQLHHASIYSADRNGTVLRFAEYQLSSGVRRFYVPASPDEPGAFEAISAKYEGFWRRSQIDEEDLPWPEADEAWTNRVAFLRELDRVEAIAERVPYRGFSICRVCKCLNGSRSLRFEDWEWPEGFRHYIAEHGVRPTREFEDFLSKCVT